MKKIQPKYTVIRELTESDIRAIASNRWMNKYIWAIILPFVFYFIAAIIISDKVNNDVGTLVFGSCSAIWVIVFFTKYYKAGKNFWNSIKDKTQPIKM